VLVSVYPFGEKLPNGFERAIKMLNGYQTLWRLRVESSIEKPQNDVPRDHFSILPQNNRPSGLSIGITKGPINQDSKIQVIEAAGRRALISEYEWRSLLSSEAPHVFWAYVLLSTCFQMTIKGCDDQTCIACSNATVDDLSSNLRNLTICEDCKEQIETSYKYRFRELLRIVNDINKDEIYHKSLPFNMPHLGTLQRQINSATEIQETIGQRLFEQYGIVVLMHFLEDLVPFLEGLLNLGAKKEAIAVLVKPYPYADRPAVHSYLFHEYPTIRVEYLDSLPPDDALLMDVVDYCVNGASGKVLVIEDGGYLVPFLHRTYPEDKRNCCIGAVEQTTKGIREDEEVEKELGKLLFPVLDVATSDFKTEYEAPLVGRSVADNIRKLLPNTKWEGCQALVIGFGAIGREAARTLASQGMIVKVYDSDKNRRAAARVRGFQTSENVTELITKEVVLVVGATGNFKQPAVSKDVLERIADGTVLASASSDRFEIDIKHLERITGTCSKYKEGVGTYYTVPTQGFGKRTCLLLADGYPVNFYSGSGIPTDAIDPVLAQLFIGAVHLARKRPIEGKILRIMNDLNAEYHLLDDFFGVMQW